MNIERGLKLYYMQSINNYEKSYAKNVHKIRIFDHRRSTVKGVVH